MPLPNDDTGGGTSSNLCSASPSDLQGQVDSLVSRVSVIEIILSQLLGVDITAIQLSDISEELGDAITSVDGILGSSVGYVPYALQTGVDTREFIFNADSEGNDIVLSGSGSTAILPFQLPSKMKFGAVATAVVAASSFSWEAHIYKENTEGVLVKVATTVAGSNTAGTKTIENQAVPYPSLLNPGSYYLAIQNAGSNSFSILAKSVGAFLTSTPTHVYYSPVRVGTAALGADTINPAAWTRLGVYGHFAIHGILDDEDLPYGFSGEFDY